MSWSESVAIDDYGSAEQRAQARGRDKDVCWEELVESPDWEIGGVGGFNFLDAIGFRYYLPVAMIRAARSGDPDGLEFHLKQERIPVFIQHTENQRTLLTGKQKHCISRFCRYMEGAWRGGPHWSSQREAARWRRMATKWAESALER